MFLDTGFMVFLSLIVIVAWLPNRTVLWLFGHPIALELPFGVMAYLLHYGTFSGMMAAAVACIMVAFLTRGGRWFLGYIKNGVYHPGVVQMKGVQK